MASTIKVDNVQNQPGTNIVSKCGTDVTLGASGDTVALAAGASQTGFGRTGTVDWITTPKVTGDSPITGVSGNGYFMNTTAGGITINLPAGSAGDIISMADYAATWQTNNVTLSPNGTDKIGGLNVNVTLGTEGQSVTLVYVDSTQGWINTMDSTSNVRGDTFMVATGGSVPAGTTVGSYKVHTFTGPGTFCVSSISCTAANNEVSYIVVAGGGGGGSSWRSGGGGAGGFRERKSSVDTYTASPLDGSTPITVTATGYPIIVGGGGAGGGPAAPARGVAGDVSTFSTVTSAGGGMGGEFYGPPASNPFTIGGPGGSGGGGGGSGPGGPGAGGPGNDPATTPNQGNDGGAGEVPGNGSGGGGGALAAGTAGGADGPAGSAGGAGAGTLINPTSGEAGPGPSRYYSGGGGGGQYVADPGTAPSGGIGGGGDGGYNSPPQTAGCSAAINTGGGGGGKAGTCSLQLSGSGGSGIVIIRYKFQ